MGRAHGLMQYHDLRVDGASILGHHPVMGLCLPSLHFIFTGLNSIQTCTGQLFLGAAKQRTRRAWARPQESGAQRGRKKLQGGCEQHALPAAIAAPSSITSFPETTPRSGRGEDRAGRGGRTGAPRAPHETPAWMMLPTLSNSKHSHGKSSTSFLAKMWAARGSTSLFCMHIKKM